MTIPTYKLDWPDFKRAIEQVVSEKWSFLYRGQANSTWPLTSSWHRLQRDTPLETYWQLLVELEDQLHTWTGRRWDLTKEAETGAFVAYLQHHGFPTPLLDWSLSPYIAAYFAFAGVDDNKPDSDDIAVFAFAHELYQREWMQRYDFSSSPHVSVLKSAALGNQRQVLHQGMYTYSTVYDQGMYLMDRAADHRTRTEEERIYLVKYVMSVHEKPRAMRDLRLMGISAMSLFPGVEGVCRYLKEHYLSAERVGMTPSERTLALQRMLDESLKKDAQQGLFSALLNPIPATPDAPAVSVPKRKRHRNKRKKNGSLPPNVTGDS